MLSCYDSISKIMQEKKIISKFPDFLSSADEELREKVRHVLRKQEERRRKEKLSSSNSETSIKSSERSPSHLQTHISKRTIGHSPSLSATKELEIETSVNIGQSGGTICADLNALLCIYRNSEDQRW